MRYNTVMAKNCDPKGRIRADNMTRAERKGYLKLLKRARNKEIVISTTDKSGRLTVSTYDSYIQQGSQHVKNDVKVTWKEVMKSKEDVLSHTRVLSHIFRVGETHGEKNEKRVKIALHEDIITVPNRVGCTHKL